MEAVGLRGYAAQGSITVNGDVLTKRCGFNDDGCLSLQNAKRNVVKSLANMIRWRLDATEGWTEWPDLSPAAQKRWLDKVAETLQWDVLQGGKVASLHSISAGEFSRALVGSLA